MQSQSRAFESLDWYRDASRREYRSNSPWRKLLRWLKSSRCFAFHIGVFALGITVALAFNIATEPEDIWVDRWLLIWLIALVVHAGMAGLLFAVSLLGSGEQPIPNYSPGAPSTPPISNWEAQARWPDAPEPEAAQPTAPAPPDWVAPQTEPNASWRELTPSSWLRRKRTGESDTQE